MKSAAVYSFDSARTIVEFKKAVRKGRRALTDYVDETTVMIKKRPLRSVGIVFGIALTLGALVGRKL